MVAYHKKRHSRWYERIFFSTTTQSCLGILFSSLLPAFILWGYEWQLNTRINTIIATSFAFICIALTLRVLMKYPGNKSSSFIISTVITWYFLILSILTIFRLDYSSLLLTLSFLLTGLFCFIGYFMARNWIVPKIAYIPLGRAVNIQKVQHVEWIELTEPKLCERRINAIVVDLHSTDLTAQWQHFLAKCTLDGIPVYNVRQLEESLTGRVKIRHMYENDLGSLLPSPVYSLVKRIMDITLIVVTFPITLPIMAITAIAIRLESEGGAMFIQNRVGQGGKEFNLYKFRSMCQDSEKDGAKFASTNDMRVTKVGKFIRKMRIDELPQFFNVLKGDMSLIGPRPEQKVFVDKFIKEIPFYNYRHIVKPGISGWAQVVHGYAADVDDTKVKLQYDLYYIKNFSIWLDILIVFKTIKTMLTGFGSR
ncbi:sugar transferase [Glaesserella parasuis]|uniref:Putative LPS sugar transferase n=1 Tax=Glaesserella parasuis TaxID=738 RepID=T1RPT1_GLAPU|nr:putative LPS sugar transferase [Glaesserella parasuis]EQA01022.1 exopolysaccharide biosynthesis polyprenyl glycosylphosphotransferase family protein [Glaesserella parasuis SW114]MDD2172508.1 sugar transferase [Glaesserella parasuis]MDP0271857.1 sugar transferase [Glaesserella parasuis]MDP0305892.1 sugar transferase [Glaesserella parasuis]